MTIGYAKGRNQEHALRHVAMLVEPAHALRRVARWRAAIRPIAAALLLAVAVCVAAPTAQAQAPAAKPNILFIMGDDIGWMQPSIYHRGLMVGETPNIDRIGQEGAIFMDYLAMQSCTSGRNAFFTGMYPLRTGMIPPQLPGSPSYLRPGTRHRLDAAEHLPPRPDGRGDAQHRPHRETRARSSWTTSPCRAAPPGAMPSSPACIRCAPA